MNSLDIYLTQISTLRTNPKQKTKPLSRMSRLEIALSSTLDHLPKHLFLGTVLLTTLYALYRWLLPKPLPGIPFNQKSAQSIWGDFLQLRDDPSVLAKWCSKQLENHGSPICQALMGPLSKPVVLVADVGNA